MPRANRHYIPGYVWHITHRCHKKEFLLKFGRDRRNWLNWLFEAKKRYGISVLNYMVTSNHIHLMVLDNGARETIPRSIQLLASRVGQEYNKRKKRKGAFWEASCKQRVDEEIATMNQTRDSKWTESIAVGSERFIDATKNLLGIKEKGRKIIGSGKSYKLREPSAPYGVNFTPENDHLSLQNAYFWADSHWISIG